MRKYFAYAAILAGISLFLFILYRNSGTSTQKRPFSTYTILSSSWEKYKQKFINEDGRVVDPSQDFITTSEGQSYGLLRAVWIDDKDTFDKLWAWTKDNLQRDKDKLFGWRWGKISNNNKYGFTSPGGSNSATDADVDIALALILASRRWQQTEYLNDAKPLLADIWKIETATASGKRYLIAGDWAENENELVLNPSYFSPYAFRIFDEVDEPSRPWQSLVDSSYEILETSISSESGLPPDWISIDRKTGILKEPSAKELGSNYSFDAMRVPFRIALDYQWNKNPRAKKFLENNFFVLKNDYIKNGKLPSGYLPNGSPLQNFENPTMYATSLGYFLVKDQKIAKKVYDSKIVRLYSSDDNSFDKSLPYYDQNWLWFGSALYNKYLSNF